MKIIDTFIACNKHETDLLFLKLLLESPCVDEWVAVENHHDYRGRYKGPQLASMLAEPRFYPYRERVKVISLDEPFTHFVVGKEANYDPPEFAEAEWRLRDAPLAYLLEKYHEQDRVFVTDIDEMVDFSDTWRAAEIINTLDKHPGQPLQFERVRYHSDFDNRAWRSDGDIISPCYTIGNLRRGQAKLRDKKWVGKLIPNGPRPTIFEYSFCFPYEAFVYKLSTSLHTNWTKGDIDISLACNHWTMRNGERVSFQNRYQWFETVELTEENSPRYVRENLTALRTGLVDPNYKENRQQHYGFMANFPENVP